MSETTWLTDSIFTVDRFLSPAQCQKYIDMAEDVGFEPALLTGPDGSIQIKDIRNNDRVMFQNREIANDLWEWAQDFVPLEWEEARAIGINEMIRIYRYDPGQKFNWHQDFPFERDNGEASKLTILVYLNEDFEGGATSFEDSYSEESFEEFSVVPQTGMALFFEHQVHHKGEQVSEGRKYVLRSDVMYSAEEEWEESEFDSFH